MAVWGMASDDAGTAYLVSPLGGPGPGVLVLHSWWGLTPGVKSTVEALADQGFTALAPALLPGDACVEATEAVERLARSDVDATAGLIVSSVAALRANSVDPAAPVGVLGYSMGASWALWVATRQPDSLAAVVAYYGLQDIDFADLRAPVLCHFAERDPLVPADAAAEMQSFLRLADKSVEVQRHAGTRHFFAETGVPVIDVDGETGERTDAEELASISAWTRTVEFLHENLDHVSGSG